MPENTLLHHFFPASGEADIEEMFGITPKSRKTRIKEITAILRKHHFLSGFSPEQFKDILEDLGPSFVKIGQILSLRSEILPPAYCQALSSLQMQSDPLPFEQIVKALENIYGERFPSIFKSIDPTPLGSASIAQVHAAVLMNGDKVAVKVQRPGVRLAMAQDIDIMRSMAAKAKKIVKDQMIDFSDVVEELWNSFLEETDFRKEAENLEEFAFLNKDTVYITCPMPYLEYCSEEVLVMEFTEGISIKETQELLDRGYDLEEIGIKIIDNYATQILDHGFFHADPHPGNLFINEGKVVYLDLGMTGRLSQRDRAGFGAIVEAVGLKSASALKDALIGFSISHDNEHIDHPKLLTELDSILNAYGTTDITDIDIGAMLTDVLALSKTCSVILPPSITAMVRGLVILEGALIDYLGNLNIIQIINDHIMRKKDPKKEIERLTTEFLISLGASAKGLSAAAEASGEAMKMLTRGQLKMNMEFMGSDEPLRKVSRIANRLTVGIIVAGLLVSASLIDFPGMPQIFGVGVLAFIQYISAFILSFVIIFDIYRKPHK